MHKKAKILTCSSCKAGEIFGVPALYKVSGYHMEESRPYRALLCEEHTEVMHDYLKNPKIKPLTPAPHPDA